MSEQTNSITPEKIIKRSRLYRQYLVLPVAILAILSVFLLAANVHSSYYAGVGIIILLGMILYQMLSNTFSPHSIPPFDLIRGIDDFLLGFIGFKCPKCSAQLVPGLLVDEDFRTLRNSVLHGKCPACRYQFAEVDEDEIEKLAIRFPSPENESDNPDSNKGSNTAFWIIFLTMFALLAIGQFFQLTPG